MGDVYDSTKDTNEHIEKVAARIRQVTREFHKRAVEHDASKRSPEEKVVFDEVTPLLHKLTYGSPEYKESLAMMKPALDHHYTHNRHHPEFFENGIRGMHMLDLMEMLCDWLAATERHADGDIRRSLEINRERYDIPDGLYFLLRNTIDWFEGEDTGNGPRATEITGGENHGC